MKLKTRFMIVFISFVLLPVIIFVALFAGLGQLRIRSIEKQYGIEFSTGYFFNSVQAIREATEELCEQMRQDARENPDMFLRYPYLQDKNALLREKMSYLVILRGEDIYYQGTESDISELVKVLPGPDEDEAESASGTYIGGDTKILIRKIELPFSDGTDGCVYVVTPATAVIPQLRGLILQVIVLIFTILIFTAACMTIWIYQGISTPIRYLRTATKRITSGDLDFTVKAEGSDEISDLCRDFEMMRSRLKTSEAEKTKYDKESKELISNISHDLKTPLTTIKGYVEGIMDGVADTPEKMDRYIKTIYNKTIEMDRLINELTFYSKIDTNRIPYLFTRLNVLEYFDDCAEEVSMDLEGRGIRFTYENTVGKNVRIIADAEQLKRVVSNIIGNSVKYMDKPHGEIALRIRDEGDFIHVEIEDNGKGIEAKDLAYIFDRFYRTDASRNSAQGGSGIGLSIVKKIIEDHSGKIWAASRVGYGTTMHFVIRKYQEAKHEQDPDHRR
ncbi:MAG: HAMP domain-containing histidine kinase [Lachnospiraceae bacterium]|nr:HAMP domain-containing histidine kinase [Lachnospiraceae bacterium]